MSVDIVHSLLYYVTFVPNHCAHPPVHSSVRYSVCHIVIPICKAPFGDLVYKTRGQKNLSFIRISIQGTESTVSCAGKRGKRSTVRPLRLRKTVLCNDPGPEGFGDSVSCGLMCSQSHFKPLFPARISLIASGHLAMQSNN